MSRWLLVAVARASAIVVELTVVGLQKVATSLHLGRLPPISTSLAVRRASSQPVSSSSLAAIASAFDLHRELSIVGLQASDHVWSSSKAFKLLADRGWEGFASVDHSLRSPGGLLSS
jgi:hypothetical protein